MKIAIRPLTENQIETYVAVGKQSYFAHYLHLWHHNDPTSFVAEHLTVQAIKKGLLDPDQFFYIIYNENNPVGILKLTLDADDFDTIPKKNVLLNKIYLIKEYTGQGLGAQCLNFVESFARDQRRKVIWLYTMKKGKAIHFYKKWGYHIYDEATIKLEGIRNEEAEMWVMKKSIT